MAPRQTFEQYTSRVICVILVGFMVWLISHGHGDKWGLYFWVLVMGKMAVTGFDFHRERSWGVLLILLLLGSLICLIFLAHPEELGRERRICGYLVSASIFGEAGLLLLGRHRKVWGFCRIPPERLSGERR
jgi:peptidoglycan/LPS O-acetylase OafA/YrhL